MSGRKNPGLSVSRKELAQALAILRPIVKGARNPALASVLMRAGTRPDGPCLTISATDLQTSLSLKIGREDGAEDFAVLVDLVRLSGFVSADWGERLELCLGKGRLEIHGQTLARIAIEDLDTFPTLPEAPQGDGVELPAEVIREAAAIRGFVETKHPMQVPGWQRLVHVFEREGKLNVLAGCGARLVWRQGFEGGAAGGAVGIAPEGTILLAGLVEGLAGTLYRKGDRQDFFSGEDYELAFTRVEHGAPSLAWIFEQKIEGWRDLPALGEMLPVIQAVASEAGLTHPILLLEMDDKTEVSCRTDLIESEGVFSAGFPRFKTGYADDLVEALKALERIGGAEAKIQATKFSGVYLRLRIEGVVEVLLSGMV